MPGSWRRPSRQLVDRVHTGLLEVYGGDVEVPTRAELAAYDASSLEVLLRWLPRGVDEPHPRALVARACARAWEHLRLPAEPQVYERIRRMHSAPDMEETRALLRRLEQRYGQVPDLPGLVELSRLPRSIHSMIEALVEDGWPAPLLCALVDEAAWQTYLSIHPRAWRLAMEHDLELA